MLYEVITGLGLLPEDRKRYGLALKSSIAWNTVAVSLKSVFPSGIVSERKNRKIAEDYVKLLKTSTPDVVRPVSQLSGGNQQKVVIAKWLSAKSDVIIFDEPTRGIDVGAKMEIRITSYNVCYTKLLRRTTSGVLVFSSLT